MLPLEGNVFHKIIWKSSIFCTLGFSQLRLFKRNHAFSAMSLSSQMRMLLEVKVFKKSSKEQSQESGPHDFSRSGIVRKDVDSESAIQYHTVWCFKETVAPDWGGLKVVWLNRPDFERRHWRFVIIFSLPSDRRCKLLAAPLSETAWKFASGW
jgi:hypothetical protein